MGGGKRQRSWLRHYATSRKVAGSVPDKVTRIFSLPILSSRTMALRLTQPLIGNCITNLPGDKGHPTRKADNLTAISEPTVYKMWELRRLTNLWASTACCSDSLTFFCRLGNGKRNEGDCRAYFKLW
jgi:hypothetical protein